MTDGAGEPEDPRLDIGERPRLDPPVEEMREIGYRAVDMIVDHLASLSEQRVARRGTAAEFAARVDEALPRQGRGADDTLRFFFDRVVPGMTHVNHPRFHAYIPSPGSFLGTIGEILAAGTNPFVGSWLGGATVASLELTVVRWIAEAVGYEASAAGLFTSGGSLANLIALAAARQRFGAATVDDVLYFSEQGHESAEKAARILGYGGSSIRRVAVDESFRLDVDALERTIASDRRRNRRPTVVCANAGTTNTGAVDPLTELAGVCRREGLWFHVDAAYGGFAAISKVGRRRLEGMQHADSLTLDPHKWLSAPMGTGCVLVRDRESLEGAFRTEADYLKDVPRDEVNFFDRGPELSRPARVLGVWTLIRAVGIDALAAQIDADLELAALAERLLAGVRGLEIVCATQLSVVTFRNRRREDESEDERAARDTALMEDTLAEGEVMISTTMLEGRSALRFVVQNHRTNEEELRRSVAAIERKVVS